MRPRSPEEAHRASTPLELFFDLVFVVAISQASSGLHHAVAEGHAADGLLTYTVVFFGIWLAWINFTWFASAYDNDDVPYRLLVLVQMSGALIMAAGANDAFAGRGFVLPTMGFVVMRFAMVTQWLRAAHGDPARRRTARRYAAGIAACQVGWVSLLFLPADKWLYGCVVFATAELLVPVWAERAGPTPWHQDHIVERYGLMTIIVLGESILAAAVAVRAATVESWTESGILSVCAGGVLIVFSLWWIYFERPQGDLRATLATAFIWGYGHLPIFAAGAAVGAGLGVAIDHATGDAAISEFTAGAAVAVPVAVFLLFLWALHVRPAGYSLFNLLLVPLFIVAILLTPLTDHAVLLCGVLLAALLALKLLLWSPTAA